MKMPLTYSVSLYTLYHAVVVVTLKPANVIVLMLVSHKNSDLHFSIIKDKSQLKSQIQFCSIFHQLSEHHIPQPWTQRRASLYATNTQ